MDNRNSTISSIDHVIRSRRTSMFTDSQDIDPSTVIELCELASWAPCHKRTWPWEFALLTGPARERFGASVADAMHSAGDDPARVAKARTKYLRTPAILVVASAQGDTQLRTVENRDATAAAIQNILLAATARGLASFWSSCPRGCNDTVVEFCGFSENASIVGIVYLGYATTSADTPPRPAPSLSMIST
ncbi:MAG: nitroreductase [Actinomycetota bacterium]